MIDILFDADHTVVLLKETLLDLSLNECDRRLCELHITSNQQCERSRRFWLIETCSEFTRRSKNLPVSAHINELTVLSSSTNCVSLTVAGSWTHMTPWVQFGWVNLVFYTLVHIDDGKELKFIHNPTKTCTNRKKHSLLCAEMFWAFGLCMNKCFMGRKPHTTTLGKSLHEGVTRRLLCYCSQLVLSSSFLPSLWILNISLLFSTARKPFLTVVPT